MSTVRRQRPRPEGRRAVAIAVLLSLLLPGLGHVYAMHLQRALIWFGGSIAIWVVLQGGEEDTARAVGLGIALAILAALDAILVMWLDARSRGRR